MIRLHTYVSDFVVFAAESFSWSWRRHSEINNWI